MRLQEDRIAWAPDRMGSLLGPGGTEGSVSCQLMRLSPTG